MMNILIINPPIRIDDKPRHIPHGLSILANIIRENFKSNILFVDWNAHRYTSQKFDEIVKQFPCQILLIGGLISTYKYIISISETIKKYHPDCKIIAGGSVAMSAPEILLSNSQVDIICTGEGEKTIISLLELFKYEQNPNLDKVNGIAFKYNGEIVTNPPQVYIQNLDKESALPAYDMLDMEIYLSNPVVGIGRDIDFISSRGCPYNCTFCYQPWGRLNRRHSVEFIKDAILYLKKRYKINFVSFQDDLFIADRKRLFKFCEIRNHFFPDIYWSCTGRANMCDEELIKHVRESGCTAISYGFESASPKILKSMNKKITTEEMENVVRLNRKYDLPIPVSFILGMPGEDELSCQQTIDFCLNNNLTLDSLMFATPYPGTHLFDFAIKTGRINKNDIHNFIMKIGDARDFIINLTDNFTDDQLKNKFIEMKTITKKAHKPISKYEMQKKIKSLYGQLSDIFFNLSKEDIEHQKKHGAINLF